MPTPEDIQPTAAELTKIAVTLNDADTAPLSAAQDAVLREILTHFQAKPAVRVFETIHGHIVQAELDLFLGIDSPQAGRLAQKDLAFLASLGERLRWVEAYPRRLLVGL